MKVNEGKKKIKKIARTHPFPIGANWAN